MAKGIRRWTVTYKVHWAKCETCHQTVSGGYPGGEVHLPDCPVWKRRRAALERRQARLAKEARG